MDAVIILVIFIVTLIGPFTLLGLKYWAYFWITVALALAVWEWVVYVRKGKTLSQRFWTWKRSHKKESWYVLAALLAFWLALLGHLYIHD